jgi:hypothetical protein
MYVCILTWQARVHTVQQTDRDNVRVLYAHAGGEGVISCKAVVIAAPPRLIQKVYIHIHVHMYVCMYVCMLEVKE